MLLNYENLFLIILAIVWLVGAVLQDLKRREVDNLWNFSLVIFALGYRFIVMSYSGNYWFFINGIIGVVVFFVLGNLFYYSRLFAGGDAKLLIALGGILPLSYDWIINVKIFGIYILSFLFLGSLYVLIWAIFLMFINWKKFKKEFLKQWRIYHNYFFVFFVIILLFILIVLLLGKNIFVILGIILSLFPVLFIFAKSIEESCMIKALDPKKITEGEWLYKNLKVGKKKIIANWEGISEDELRLIRNKYKKKVLIKQGIPFTPSFLIGFLILLFILWKYKLLF
ncbi:MAG: hypothetical protein QXW97_01915 [Candidatus Pacearchaeota archaeon]